MMSQDLNQAFTFGDVSLVPAYSQIIPKDVDIICSLAEKITLKIPMLSAAMDTVTTSALAIALAQAGGLGIIHKNMSISSQRKEVFQVKKYEAWVISQPITISPNATIGDAKILVKDEAVSGFPVVSESGELLGMLTSRDMRFCQSDATKVQDIMSKNLVKTSPNADTDLCISLMKERRVEKLPLVDQEQKLCGLVTIKDINKSQTFPDSVRDERGRLCCGAALGCTQDLEERSHALVDAGVDSLVLDSAHGHSKHVRDALIKLRQWFPDILLIAGNIVTAEGALFLAQAGADIVKVGVGPGSICTTRIVAGVGIPQLSAILDVGKAAREHGFGVIADGGIQFSGDIVKALGAGAHAIMTGSLFAGAKEAPGERIIFGGREYKTYRGMGSLGAMQEGSKDRYNQEKISQSTKFVPEGIEGKIPYRGSVSEIVYQLMGGLKAGMGYVGAQDISELQKKARFVRVTPAGQRESHVHDVSITKEAPNYNFQV